MKRQRALHLIRESLELAKHVSTEQKIQILKTVRECYSKLKHSKSNDIIAESAISSNTDPDYVQEK